MGQEKEILFKAGKLLKTWILANGKKKKNVEIGAQKDFDKLPCFRIHEVSKNYVCMMNKTSVKQQTHRNHMQSKTTFA